MDKRYYKICSKRDNEIMVREKDTGSFFRFTLNSNIEKLSKYHLFDCLEIDMEFDDKIGRSVIHNITYLGKGTMESC